MAAACPLLQTGVAEHTAPRSEELHRRQEAEQQRDVACGWKVQPDIVEEMELQEAAVLPNVENGDSVPRL